MDPNETLRLIRARTTQILAGTGDYSTAGEQLAMLVECLDAWLARGSALPTSWQRDDGSTDVATAWRGAELLWGADSVGEVAMVRRVRDGRTVWCATVTDRRSRETIDGAGPTPVAAVGELNQLLAARLRAAKR